MAKTIENKLGENFLSNSLDYARKKAMPYAMTCLMLFNTAMPAYSAVQAQKAKATTPIQQTVKPNYNKTAQKVSYNAKPAEKKKKKSFLGTVVDTLNPFHTYESCGKTTNLLIKGGKILIYAGGIYALQKKDPQPDPTPEPIDKTKDTNGDGVPDYWCIQHGLDIYTDRRLIDTDLDGAYDYYEYNQKTNPIDKNSYPQDDSHALRAMSYNSKVCNAIENKSQLETSLSVNPKDIRNSSINFLVPAGKNTMIYGNLSKENVNVKVAYKF